MSFQELQGDFWCEANRSYSAIVCTINTTLKKDGTLVMGAGIAKDFAEYFDWLPDRWGVRTKQMLASQTKRTHPFLELPDNGKHPFLIGIHTKYDWKERSPLSLVDRSIKQLYIIANALDWDTILMTRPGCGNGGLSWEKQVRPLLEEVLDERFMIITNE